MAVLSPDSQSKMNYTINVKPATTEVYNNAEAHKEVRAMMARGERMAMFFALDKYGCETVRIESRTTQRFTYQLNQNSLNWLLGYLANGTTEDCDVDPSAPVKTSETSDDSFRKAMLMAFVNAKVGNFQTRPAFLDRPGRLTTTATFKHGSIQFFTERDEEIENFLQEHKLIG